MSLPRTTYTMKDWRYVLFPFLPLQPNSLTSGMDCATEWFDVNPLDHCEIFDKYLTFKFSRLFENPKCIKEIQITIGRNRSKLHSPSQEVRIRNPIQDKCKTTRVEIRAKDKMGKQKKYFELNPRKCFNEFSKRIPKFTFQETGDDRIHMNITSEIFKSAQMRNCLSSAKIDSDFDIDMLPDEHGMKIKLDRSKQQIWHMRYHLKNHQSPMFKKITIPRAGEIKKQMARQD